MAAIRPCQVNWRQVDLNHCQYFQHKLLDSCFIVYTRSNSENTVFNIYPLSFDQRWQRRLWAVLFIRYLAVSCMVYMPNIDYACFFNGKHTFCKNQKLLSHAFIQQGFFTYLIYTEPPKSVKSPICYQMIQGHFKQNCQSFWIASHFLFTPSVLLMIAHYEGREISVPMIFAALQAILSFKNFMGRLNVRLGFYYEMNVISQRFANIFNIKCSSLVKIDGLAQPNNDGDRVMEKGEVSFQRFYGFWKDKFSAPSLSDISLSFEQEHFMGLLGKQDQAKVVYSVQFSEKFHTTLVSCQFKEQFRMSNKNLSSFPLVFVTTSFLAYLTMKTHIIVLYMTLVSKTILIISKKVTKLWSVKRESLSQEARRQDSHLQEPFTQTLISTFWMTLFLQWIPRQRNRYMTDA